MHPGGKKVCMEIFSIIKKFLFFFYFTLGIRNTFEFADYESGGGGVQKQVYIWLYY